MRSTARPYDLRAQVLGTVLQAEDAVKDGIDAVRDGITVTDGSTRDLQMDVRLAQFRSIKL